MATHIVAIAIIIMLLAYFCFWIDRFTTKAIKHQKEILDQEKSKNYQAIRDWLDQNRKIVAPGNPMYHENDVIRFIKILKPGFEA
jgi:hypothetical protein